MTANQVKVEYLPDQDVFAIIFSDTEDGVKDFTALIEADTLSSLFRQARHQGNLRSAQRNLRKKVFKNKGTRDHIRALKKRLEYLTQKIRRKEESDNVVGYFKDELAALIFCIEVAEDENGTRRQMQTVIDSLKDELEEAYSDLREAEL